MTEYIVKKNLYYTEIIKYYPPNKMEHRPKKDRDYDMEAARRAKRTIIDYALNNTWEYMLNITFDNKKFTLTREAARNAIQREFKAIKRKRKEFQYIIVAEEGKKTKRLHFHALLSFQGTYELHKEACKFMFYNKKKRYAVYRWESLFKAFGANQTIPIKSNTEYLAYYISKYITKEQQSIYPMNYNCSRGLNKSQVLDWPYYKIHAEIYESGLMPTYENDFIQKWRIPFMDHEPLDKIIDTIKPSMVLLGVSK